jgi:hypothetical protein
MNNMNNMNNMNKPGEATTGRTINLAEFQATEGFSVDELMHALDNEENSSLENMTMQKIEENKLNAIVELGLTPDESEQMRAKLDGYMYVDEIPDMRYGAVVRWVSLKNPDVLRLTKGGIVTNIDVCTTGTVVTCKSFGVGTRFFRVKMDDAMIFRRLTDQEMVILAAVKYLT